MNKKSKKIKLSVKNIKVTYQKATNKQTSRQLRYYYRLKYKKLAFQVYLKENQFIHKTQKVSQDTLNSFPSLNKFHDQIKWERYRGITPKIDKDLHLRLKNVKQATVVTNKIYTKGMEGYIHELANWEAKHGRKKNLNAFERKIVDDWGSEEWGIYWKQYYSHYFDESIMIK